MTRLGWLLLAVFLLIAAAFIAMLGPPRISTLLPTVSAPLAPERSSSLSLQLPVAGVGPKALVDSFNDPRDNGRRIHGAIDIPATRGTAVLAAADGAVEKLFESRPGGHTIYERSRDGGIVYYYAHLDRYAPGFGEGAAVRRGQTIGFVGSTGDANPAAPHLHFEVHHMAPGEPWSQGTPIDPYPLLAGRAAGG